MMNQLMLGDNLEILKNLPSESIDLIYIDPPFFSNRNYEVIWGDKGEVRSFEDRWSGGMMQYIGWLKDRVEEMYRLLKPTGSIFVHCDWHANAYIRVYILDKLFGENNFRNEVIWFYRRWTNVSRQFQNMHDTIFWYSKTNNYTFNKNGYEPSESQQKKFEKGWDQNVVKDSQGNKITQYIIYNKEKFEKNAKITPDARLVYRETESLKVAPPDVLEISVINSQSEERIGYPTQKPIELIEKLIRTASNEGDVVLDAFVGGGTTIAVADRLNRNWIGIDQSVQAIKVTEFRLNKQQDLFSKPFTVTLHKYDYDTLRYKDAFEFEGWIVAQYGGSSNQKQRGDLGLDGKTREGVPIQVKRSDNIGRNVIDNFKSAIERFDKNLFQANKQQQQTAGIIIAFSFGKGAIEEVARLRTDEGLIIQLVKVEDIVPIAKKPTIQITFKDLGIDAKGLREIAFKAVGNSDAGVEFYAWDFSLTPNKGEGESSKGFKPDVLLDKSGEQIYKFKAGIHHIAVKVVDNDGLEAIEVIKLKVNGVVRAE